MNPVEDRKLKRRQDKVLVEVCKGLNKVCKKLARDKKLSKKKKDHLLRQANIFSQFAKIFYSQNKRKYVKKDSVNKD